MKDKKKYIIVICVLSCLLLFLLGIVYAFQCRERNRHFLKQEVESEEAEEETTEETTDFIQPETQSPEEETVFPQPEYPFREEEVTIAVDGLGREYTIAWVSDLHLVSDHASGEKLGDVHAEYLDAVGKRYEQLAVTPDGICAETLWPELIKYLNFHHFDGVIFGGDLMDYCSNSNIELIRKGLDSLNTRYMYIRADHDYGTYYGGVFFTETEAKELHRTIDDDEISRKFWDMGDFIVLGIDNSTKDMPEYYLNMVTEVFGRNKPVILATHVPYESQLDTSLAELSMQVRGTLYYWNSEGTSYVPNPVTRQYLDKIYDPSTAVVHVLAGHLHASWDGMLTEQVSQHIFAPAFGGNVGIIHVVPKT